MHLLGLRSVFIPMQQGAQPVAAEVHGVNSIYLWNEFGLQQVCLRS